jgi:Tfp pilus assembly protein PilZ
MAPEAPEKRQHPRYEIMAQIRVKRGRTNYIMDVRNVCLSGLFVSSENIKQMPWFREGQELEMDLFTQESLENVRVKGRIVWIIAEGSTEKLGFGVTFTDMNIETNEYLETFIKRTSEELVLPPPLPKQNI